MMMMKTTNEHMCITLSLSLSLSGHRIEATVSSCSVLHIMMVSDGPFPLHSIGYAYNTAKRSPIPLCRILLQILLIHFFHPLCEYSHLIPFSSHSWCFLLWILPLPFMSWNLTYSWTSVQFTNSFRLSMVWSSVHIEFWNPNQLWNVHGNAYHDTFTEMRFLSS
jgi:hypothetical protein